MQGLLRVAQQHNVTQIVVGKPVAGRLPGLAPRGEVAAAADARERRTSICTWSARRRGDRQARAARPVARSRSTGNNTPPPSGPWPASACSTWHLQFTGPRVPGFVFLLAVVLLALFLGRGPVFLAGAAERPGLGLFFFAAAVHVHHHQHRGRLPVRALFRGGNGPGAIGVPRPRPGTGRAAARGARQALYQLTRELAQAGTRDEVVWQLDGRSGPRVSSLGRRRLSLRTEAWPPIRTARSP